MTTLAQPNIPFVGYHRPPEFGTPILTILGERQVGKTHAALLYALCEGYMGSRVLYVSDGCRQAEIRMKDCIDIAERLDMQIHRICLTNGDYHLAFESGGKILFRPQSRRAYTKSFDIMFLDDDTKEALDVAHRIVRVIGTTY